MKKITNRNAKNVLAAFEVGGTEFAMVQVKYPASAADAAKVEFAPLNPYLALVKLACIGLGAFEHVRHLDAGDMVQASRVVANLCDEDLNPDGHKGAFLKLEDSAFDWAVKMLEERGAILFGVHLTAVKTSFVAVPEDK